MEKTQNPVKVLYANKSVHDMDNSIVVLGEKWDSNPNTKAYDLLSRNAKSMFPEITFKEKQEWSGHRPATVDSLPLIGPSHINEQVFLHMVTIT